MKLKKTRNLLAIRMKDGEDFFKNPEKAAEQHQIKSEVILTGLGMLKHAKNDFFFFAKYNFFYVHNLEQFLYSDSLGYTPIFLHPPKSYVQLRC